MERQDRKGSGSSAAAFALAPDPDPVYAEPMERHYSTLDRIIAAVDEALRISTGEAPAPYRENPAADLASPELFCHPFR